MALLALLAALLAGNAIATSLMEKPGFLGPEFPAQDSHQQVTIAAIPVPDTAAAEKIFGPKAAPTRAGFLPVELVITNDRAEAVRVDLERIKVLSDGDQYEQADAVTMAWRLYPPPKPKKPIDPTRLPSPSSIPKDKNRGAREEAEASLRSRQLRASVIPPGATARGYLYFNLRGGSIDLARSSVYIPEVTVVPTGEGLLFFEISLKPYAAVSGR
jgi:hypothetical protein